MCRCTTQYPSEKKKKKKNTLIIKNLSDRDTRLHVLARTTTGPRRPVPTHPRHPDFFVVEWHGCLIWGTRCILRVCIRNLQGHVGKRSPYTTRRYARHIVSVWVCGYSTYAALRMNATISTSVMEPMCLTIAPNGYTCMDGTWGAVSAIVTIVLTIAVAIILLCEKDHRRICFGGRRVRQTIHDDVADASNLSAQNSKLQSLQVTEVTRVWLLRRSGIEFFRIFSTVLIIYKMVWVFGAAGCGVRGVSVIVTHFECASQRVFGLFLST